MHSNINKMVYPLPVLDTAYDDIYTPQDVPFVSRTYMCWSEYLYFVSDTNSISFTCIV